MNSAPHSFATSTIVGRTLQQNSNSNSNNPNNQDGGSDNLVFGGVVFLPIMLFIIASCLWRKRGTSSSGTTAAAGGANQQQQKAATVVVPTPDFGKLLEQTTIKVTKENLIKKDKSHRITGGISSSQRSGLELDNSSHMFDIELGAAQPAAAPFSSADMNLSSKSLAAEEDRALQLPNKLTNGTATATNNSSNGNRLVPSLCAICLSSYRVGQDVSWSAATPQECSHAYHTSCIVPYAETATAKKRKQGEACTHVPCPLCRQTFVE